MDIFFRLAALALHAVRVVYWSVTEKKADSEKPKLEKSSPSKTLKRQLSLFFGIIMAFQLLGLRIFPFEQTVLVQTIGFILVVIGITTTMLARYTLGTNWAHAAEYQIKKGHTLVTGGIYNYIRHPLYSGMFFAVVGAEIVAGSYFFIVAFFFEIFWGLSQAKKEEAILTEKFGAEYTRYMARTKRFLPFVW